MKYFFKRYLYLQGILGIAARMMMITNKIYKKYKEILIQTIVFF
jgi:hypothetical protein